MKKLMLAFFVFCTAFLTGCDSVDNTPTKQVEAMLSKYQTNDAEVLDNLNKMVDTEDDLTDEQRTKYKEILKKQYQSLMYVIKEESIDGDNAEVEVEIEVIDLTKAINESEAYLNDNEKEFINDKEELNQEKYTDYKLEQMKKATTKVKYTLELTLTKTDNEWHLDNLTETERQKIHGIYNY